ncbi:MAG: hypothetical protein QM820_47045 [Minicystis sp.]
MKTIKRRKTQKAGVVATLQLNDPSTPLNNPGVGLHQNRNLATARWFACIAGEEHFSTRRGTIPVEGREQIALYDNNPTPRRDAEHERLRSWLAERGIPILAEASYPAEGPEAGYTTVMLVEAAHERDNEIAVVWQDILRSMP